MRSNLDKNNIIVKILQLVLIGFLGFNTLFSQDLFLTKNNLSKPLLFEETKDSVKSPGKAALYSAILPGLGQIYNDSYWKLPIIYGVSAYFVYEYFYFNKDFKDYSNKYNESLNPNSTNYYRQTYFKAVREWNRDNRDAFVWYMGLLYMVNILDAFIDAHLYNFSVDDKIQIGPGNVSGGYQLRLRINF